MLLKIPVNNFLSILSAFRRVSPKKVLVDKSDKIKSLLKFKPLCMYNFVDVISSFPKNCMYENNLVPVLPEKDWIYLHFLLYDFVEIFLHFWLVVGKLFSVHSKQRRSKFKLTAYKISNHLDLWFKCHGQKWLWQTPSTFSDFVYSEVIRWAFFKYNPQWVHITFFLIFFYPSLNILFN